MWEQGSGFFWINKKQDSKQTKKANSYLHSGNCCNEERLFYYMISQKPDASKLEISFFLLANFFHFFERSI